jgi:soluble P-type ATPase
MIRIEIPGSGFIELEHFVTDFSGTLSEDGILLTGVKEKLNGLSKMLMIHILTSDTFGRAMEELKGEDHVTQKKKYVIDLGPDRVVALGNGNNDALMLKAARLGISVCLKEGCSKDALDASEIFVKSPIDAIDLLLEPKRLIATLRV